MALVCSEAQAYGDVRLADKTEVDLTLGRLEVYLDGRWGTVCSDRFTKGAAQTVCHQLGYQVNVMYDTVVSLG